MTYMKRCAREDHSISAGILFDLLHEPEMKESREERLHKERPDYKAYLLSVFFSRWPSSTIIYLHSKGAKWVRSRMIISYVVRKIGVGSIPLA